MGRCLGILLTLDVVISYSVSVLLRNLNYNNNLGPNSNKSDAPLHLVVT